MNFKKILVAIDGSDLATRVADVAVELARALGGEVALVHAVDAATGHLAESLLSPSDMIPAAEEEGKRLLAEMRQRMAAQPPSLEILPVGSPATEVVKAAKDWSADLIVIGSHGRAGVQKVLFGSVGESVMRNAPCPVLVVRAEG